LLYPFGRRSALNRAGRQSRRVSKPRLRSPTWKKAKEMEEDHTSASLGACPCHQLRAHESELKRIFCGSDSSFDLPAHMNTEAVTRQPSSLLWHQALN